MHCELLFAPLTESPIVVQLAGANVLAVRHASGASELMFSSFSDVESGEARLYENIIWLDAYD